MPIIIDPRTGLPYPVRTDRAPRSRRQGRVPGPADVAKIDAQVLRDPGVHATPADFGAGIGKAIEQFGAAASRVAADFATMRREAEDDTAAAAGLSEARVRFTRIARSMETQATTTEGLTGNLGKALSEETDAILRDLREVRGFRPSKGGEATIRRQLGLLASRMVARGAMSEHRIRLAKLGHDVDFSVADAAMAAFDAPGDVFAIIAETEASLAKFKDKLPPDILAAKVAAAREMIAGNAVAGLVEQGDVATARTLLEAAGTGDGVSLSPDQAGRLRKAVDRVEDQSRRARRPAAEAEIEDHLASIQVTGAGLGVTERARAALDGKAFKAFQRNEKDAHAFHETMESLKFARPDVIDRELESRRPKRGARNFAEKQRRFQVLKRGAKQLLNVRARDGAAVVMEMGDVKAAFERAGDDGPSLRRALKFRMAMQADIGMPEDRVRLLSRAEAGALAGEVQSAATQDKAAKIAGLQDLYGPLFGRAMKELSKAGLDPRFQVLAVARDNPALARAIAQVIGTEHAELEKGLDGAAVKDLRRRLRDLAPDGRPAAAPGGETAREVKAVLSVAENLALRNLRETGDVEVSAARAAAFANDAIEDARLMAGEGQDDQLAGDAGERIPAAGGQSPAREGEVEVDAKPAQADNAKSMPQSQVSQAQVSQAQVSQAQVSQAQVSQGHPWPASPVRPKFGDELHKLESPQRSYQEEIPGQAWGRYQMTKPALKDLGMMDAKGNWTGKHGIHNSNEFLRNPKVQEKVLAEYMKRNLDQLRANGALGDMGQKISGVKAQITVTESGLLAAAHRQGAGMVMQYLDHQRRHNWTTNPKTFPKNKKDQFLSVETRLREFQNVPVWIP